MPVINRIAAGVIARFVFESHTYGLVETDCERANAIAKRFKLSRFTYAAFAVFPPRM